MTIFLLLFMRILLLHVRQALRIIAYIIRSKLVSFCSAKNFIPAISVDEHTKCVLFLCCDGVLADLLQRNLLLLG